MSVDDDLDALFAVPPDEFVALRRELAAAAKARGDRDAADHIAAARRPTTAAWVLNTLVRTDDTVRTRLTAMAAELRAAHAAMDGPRIRELTGAQRALIAELMRVSFAAAGMANPSASIREDVTATLQAAIADPAVAARLGRLEKAEEWSGFGDFGMSTVIGAPPQVSQPDPTPEVDDGARLRVAKERHAQAVEEARRASQVYVQAAATAADRQEIAAAARRHYEELVQALSAAEHDVDVADAELADARQSEADAAEHVTDTKKAVTEADSELR